MTVEPPPPDPTAPAGAEDEPREPRRDEPRGEDDDASVITASDDDVPAPIAATSRDDDAAPAVSPDAAPTSLAALQAAVADPAPATPASERLAPIPAAPTRGEPPAPPRPTTTPPRKRAATDDDNDDGAPRVRRRWPLIVAAIGTVVAAIAVLVVLGKVHAQRYAMRCGAKTITAERGRSFPPWGYERLGGAAWKPIAIPPGAECTSRETDDVVELEGWFLAHLTEQAQSKLEGAVPGDVDRAELELEQALLLSRSPERRDLRKELERLRGDVTYWRAAAKVKAATVTLADAAQAFDDAAAQRPRHASDPARWATFVRSLAASLAAGPDGTGQAPPTPTAAPSRPLAPPGVALPVEPPVMLEAVDAGVPADANARGLPTGGVLM